MYHGINSIIDIYHLFLKLYFEDILNEFLVIDTVRI